MTVFKVDLHVHTIYGGDSPMTGEELLEAARASGMDGVCVTDHDSYLSSEPLENIFGGSEIVLFRGAECSTGYGHLILLGIDDDRFQGLNTAFDSAQEIIDFTNSLGGAVIVPHPFSGGHRYAAGPFLEQLNGICALEIASGPALVSDPDTTTLAEETAARLGLPGVGGSDAHYPAEVGRCYTEFYRRIETVSDLIAELRANNCRAWPETTG